MAGVIFQPLIAGSVNPKVLTYVTTVSSTSDTTAYTFTSTSLGASTDSDKRVILAISGQGNPLSDGGAQAGISSVTVGGSSATSIVSQSSVSSSGGTVAIYIIATTSTSANIVVNWTHTPGACNVSVWNCTGLISNTAYNSGGSTSTPGSIVLNTIAGGFAIACGSHNSVMSYTWGGTSNERFDTTDGESRTFSSSDISSIPSTTVTSTATYSATDTTRAMCAASW